MQIVVNGESRHVADEISVAELLRSLSISNGRVAVEVNLEVVRREAQNEKKLADGDQVEIVSFVGGGC